MSVGFPHGRGNPRGWESFEDGEEGGILIPGLLGKISIRTLPPLTFALRTLGTLVRQ